MYGGVGAILCCEKVCYKICIHSCLLLTHTLYFQTQSELQSVREELTRERQNCEELKQKLTAAEKELKSSAVINLELEDYQRSMKTLEEQLTTRSSELERVRKDGQLQHDSMMQLKKELGKVILVNA